ncbi:MAG: LysE family transporter [Chloroflexi bacterium]|nr:LysE family transporter [Chloroflexota bacterium]
MPEPTLLIVFVTSFVVGLSGALLPGPLLAMDIAQTARHGFWAGPGIVLGHGITEFTVAVLIALGMSQLLDQKAATGAIDLAGGLLLLVMGISMVKNARKARMGLEANPGRNSTSRLRVPLAGAMASLFNPGWVIWWATIGATYVVWALGMGVAGLVAFYLGHVLADLAWYSLVSGLIATGRRWLRDAAYRGLLVACGLFVLAMGAFFLKWGADKLV